MPLELRNMEVEPPVSKLKLCEVGSEQNGKSRLAATGRVPILFHDFDNKRESLQGIPGVYAITYIDPAWPKQPDAFQLFLDVVSQLEESLDLNVLSQKFNLGLNVAPGTLVRTNVVDSINTCGKSASNYAMFNSPDLRRDIVLGKGEKTLKLFIQKNWDAWNAEVKAVENAVLRLLALPSDTIIILHETEEEAADSTPEKKRFTGRAGVYPARYQALLKYFPEVWRIKLTQIVANNQTKYVPRVYPFPNYEFDSGTTMLLDETEEPNIRNMIAKHESRLKQRSLSGGQPPSKALPQGVKI